MKSIDEMNTRKWLIKSLRYYRKLHLFEQYKNLSDNELADTLEILQMEDEGSDGTFNDKSEWSVPQLDKNRVVHIAFDCLYDDNPFSGVALLDLAKISRGAFLPQKITLDWVNECEKSIEFTLNGVRHSIRSNGDPLILAKKINPLIVETGYQIEVWNLSPDALVVVLTPDEKQRLEEERAWRFFNLNFV